MTGYIYCFNKGLFAKKKFIKTLKNELEDEFESMKSSGIKYYRFENRKITFIEEFFNPTWIYNFQDIDDELLRNDYGITQKDISDLKNK